MDHTDHPACTCHACRPCTFEIPRFAAEKMPLSIIDRRAQDDAFRAIVSPYWLDFSILARKLEEVYS